MKLENIGMVAGNIEGNTGVEYGADNYGRNGTKKGASVINRGKGRQTRDNAQLGSEGASKCK